MLNVLIDQVRKLFSSKTNGGRLVYKITDRLHDYKQVLLAISIAVLLGYTQFRDNFDCTGAENVDRKWLRNVCWTNGTFTLNTVARHDRDEEALPHIGIHFKFAGGQYHSVNHNYMRSLWLLLLLMAMCSYVAQRHWASIFQHDALVAFLKLPGYDKLPGAGGNKSDGGKKDALPSQVIVHNPDSPPVALTNSGAKNKDDNLRISIVINGHQARAKGSDSLSPSIEPVKLPTASSTEQLKSLDYFIEQLISLLLVRRTTAFRLLELKLKQKLLLHSICSTLMTSLQFLLPWSFIGDSYLLYGWNYFKHWLRYMLKTLRGTQINTNTVDYKLSSEIWPTMARCDYTMYGEHKTEHFTPLCSIPINEICGKMFAVIWWIVAVNLIIEICCLCWLIACSVSQSILRWSLAVRFWPKCREQVRALASLRVLRHQSQSQQATLIEVPLKSHQSDSIDSHRKRSPSTGSKTNSHQQQANGRLASDPTMSEGERKVLEAQNEQRRTSSTNLRPDKWYLWCSQDVKFYLVEKGKKIHKGSSEALNLRRRRRQSGRQEESTNVHLLLYLLHLRLGCSRRKTDHVIKGTMARLSVLADRLRELDTLDCSDYSAACKPNRATSEQDQTQQVVHSERHHQYIYRDEQQDSRDDDVDNNNNNGQSTRTGNDDVLS